MSCVIGNDKEEEVLDDEPFDELDEDGGEGVGGSGLVAFLVVFGVLPLRLLVLFPVLKVGGGCIGNGPEMSALLMWCLFFMPPLYMSEVCFIWLGSWARFPFLW